MNLAHTFADSMGGLVKARTDYDDSCIDFAGDFLDWAKCGRLAYFETTLNPRWRYHAAPEVDGMIHDLWQNEAMPLVEYMEIIGATSVDYPAENHQKEIHEQKRAGSG